MEYCQKLDLPLQLKFVKNPLYNETNYIYSIYCAREYLDDDIILMHGDLVYESTVLDSVIEFPESCMIISTTLPLPKKDFKAVVKDNKITNIGVEFFDNAYAAQPLYKILKKDWKVWIKNIIKYCENGNINCYAENAFNDISAFCDIRPLDIKDQLCNEVDNIDNLSSVSVKLQKVENRIVYMSFSTDMIHSGHIAIIKKAQHLGKLIVGVLSDEATHNFLPCITHRPQMI